MLLVLSFQVFFGSILIHPNVNPYNDWIHIWWWYVPRPSLLFLLQQLLLLMMIRSTFNNSVSVGILSSRDPIIIFEDPTSWWWWCYCSHYYADCNYCLWSYSIYPSAIINTDTDTATDSFRLLCFCFYNDTLIHVCFYSWLFPFFFVMGRADPVLFIK